MSARSSGNSRTLLFLRSIRSLMVVPLLAGLLATGALLKPLLEDVLVCCARTGIFLTVSLSEDCRRGGCIFVLGMTVVCVPM
jgi:hypothetical protein